ncbi:helix-turn-helix domain-containing protein [Tardiphaga sp.]|uniref:helix-turn-helix domain-containing protein n=1 Tax=Tardiphaga sp. TaxID=1926292 RepID=UPI0019A68F76|nr:helix-turn-helix domain-containing protein [Tardiphaga sp.]MBC7580285.1 helix-turn-helix domain-containing protein [Tardiphaga sp.]
MLTHSVATTESNALLAQPPCLAPAADQFGTVMGLASLAATTFRYQKEEEIFGEDEPTDYVYQVVHGAVRTYKLLSDGRRQIGSFHLPGDIFGLEYGSHHRVTAEAICATEVRLIQRRGLENAAKVDVQVACALWNVTSGELRHAEDHMLLLGCKTAMERVAAFLLEMDRRLAAASMVALPMCRRDIGDYLGLTLETVSRALSMLSEKGVLDFSGARQIVIRKRQWLRDINA